MSGLTDEPEIILAAALACASEPDVEHRKETRRHAARVYSGGDEWLPPERRFAHEILMLRVDVHDVRRSAHVVEERHRALLEALRDDLRALRRRLSWWQATARRIAEGAIVRIDLALGGEPSWQERVPAAIDEEDCP